MTELLVTWVGIVLLLLVTIGLLIGGIAILPILPSFVGHTLVFLGITFFLALVINEDL